MIGSGLKKYARENNMTVANGVAYGDLHGYAATLQEGSGYKMVVISGRFQRPEGMEELICRLSGLDLMKEFRVRDYQLAEDGIVIIFHDNPGTMKKLVAFVDWLTPQLSELGMLGSGYCPECGLPLSQSDGWKLVDNQAIRIHQGCLQKMQQENQQEIEQAKLEDTGSVGMGFLGALVGGLLGGVVWALIMYFGYVAAIVGFLIGWLSKKGYELLHGRKGVGKVISIVAASLIGVLFGCFASDLLTLVVMIHNGELFADYSDIPYVLSFLFQDPEYISAFLRNFALGVFFALLGMINVFLACGQREPGRR